MVLWMVLSGCSVRKNTISYTVYPVGYILNRLGGEKLKVTSIQNDSIIQRAELLEGYDAILEESEVLFHIGRLEPYLTTYNASISATKVVTKDLSTLNAIYKNQRYTPVVLDGEVTFVESPYYKGEEFSAIDMDERDLHLWMDPIAMLSVSKDIKEWLVKTYPENKVIFEEKFTDLETDLVQLDAEFQKMTTSLIKNNQEIKFVSMTATFGSWQKTYGIQVYPVILSKFGALPTESQLDSIKKRIVADNVKFIVYEENMPGDMLSLFNSIKEELGLTEVRMSNLSSLSEIQKQENTDYLSLMYENLAALKKMVTSRIIPSDVLPDESTETTTPAEQKTGN